MLLDKRMESAHTVNDSNKKIQLSHNKNISEVPGMLSNDIDDDNNEHSPCARCYQGVYTY